jgi:hypothetical protein
VINLSTLEKMDAKTLTSWLVRRTRGEEADPPLSSMHQETPDDFVAVVHGQTKDEAFRARLEEAIVDALRVVAKNPDLRRGPDAAAVRNLAALVQRRDVRAAASVLLGLAERGILGRQNRELAVDAERAVLMALARLQEPKLLAHHWLAVWRSKESALWPVATAGLRWSDPEQALTLLPAIVGRAKTHRSFPLGEVLWAFRADRNIGPPKLAKALEGLGEAERQMCRRALSEVGATNAQVEALLDEPPSSGSEGRDVPAWAKGKGVVPRKPPRWVA